MSVSNHTSLTFASDTPKMVKPRVGDTGPHRGDGGSPHPRERGKGITRFYLGVSILPQILSSNSTGIVMSRSAENLPMLLESRIVTRVRRTPVIVASTPCKYFGRQRSFIRTRSPSTHSINSRVIRTRLSMSDRSVVKCSSNSPHEIIVRILVTSTSVTPRLSRCRRLLCFPTRQSRNTRRERQ